MVRVMASTLKLDSLELVDELVVEVRTLDNMGALHFTHCINVHYINNHITYII
jgi:hypothetical protein